MGRKIPQEIIDLYDAFTHGAMGRRAFLARLSRLAGGGAAAAALMPLLMNDYARAQTIAPDDARLATTTWRFDAAGVIDLIEPEESPMGAAVDPTRHLPYFTAYRARPEGGGAHPALIVIHENRGLNPHIRDVARRFALEGFDAYAVDMLSPYGGTPEDEDKAREMIGKLDGAKTAKKLAAAVEQLKAEKPSRKVGAVGFCWGGGMVNALAAASPQLDAGVVYYGRQGAAENANAIRAALLFHYAGEDARINDGRAPYETALRAAGVEFESHLYEGAQHAFNNDTNAARYDKDAAARAWARTIAFLKAKLG